MRHWSLLAIRNWRARLVRTLGALTAIAIGAAAVVWVMCCYESVRRTIFEWATDYVGDAQVSITSPTGKYDQIPERVTRYLAQIDNVAHVCPSLMLRLRCDPWPRRFIAEGRPIPSGPSLDAQPVDITGVDLATEFEVRDHKLSAGRRLRADDEFACMLEAQYAAEHGLGVGDSLLVWVDQSGSPATLEIVGLIDRRRVGRLQKPGALTPLDTLQKMTHRFALVTSIDIVLKDGSRAALQKSGVEIRRQVRRAAPKATIRTAEARMNQIEVAQENQQFVLIILSCVAMLTSLFIILSTLSMGMVERVRQLGLLRCVGATRTQLAALVMFEAFPIGLLGIAVGVPLGLALTALTVWLVPDYVGRFAISWRGVWLAVAAGLATTLVAGFLPALAALRVSPMEAARPRANRTRAGVTVLVALAAAAVLLTQEYVVVEHLYRSVNFVRGASLAVVLLYVGYAFLAPLAVKLIGAPSVHVAATVLRVRARLLQDQVGFAVWRSAGICCGLMVGLSLIIGILVVNKSVTDGWKFPQQFPAAYVWSFEEMRADADQAVAQVAGVADFTTANSVNVIVEETPYFGADLLRSVTWYMGCDPDTFFDLIKLEFLEGDQATARELLKQGGHILIADDFARSRNKHLGDQVNVYFGTTRYVKRDYKVAGVVRSPAVDIAANYFQLHTEYNVVAAGSVIGTKEELRRSFGIEGTRAVLLNFDLPEQPPPADWPPPRGSSQAAGMTYSSFDERIPLEARWRRWREELVLRDVRRALQAPQCFTGTVAELKDQIDAELSQMMRLLTAVPSVALLVAAIGVANLMTANVTARSRQLAILRAVGATRGLVLRLVIGEAVVLGLLGSGLGLALGMHLASNIIALVERMWGFRVALELPWGYLGAAIALTVGLCVVAGVLPARRAARTNVVAALHVT
jgi:putative ABC transport system permease protein